MYQFLVLFWIRTARACESVALAFFTTALVDICVSAIPVIAKYVCRIIPQSEIWWA